MAEKEGEIGEEIEGGREGLLWRERKTGKREKLMGVCVFCFVFIFPFKLPAGEEKKMQQGRKGKRGTEREREGKRGNKIKDEGK